MKTKIKTFKLKRSTAIAVIIVLLAAALGLCFAFSGKKAEALAFTADYFDYYDSTSEDGVKIGEGKAGLLVKGFGTASSVQTAAARTGKTDIGFEFADGTYGVAAYFIDTVNPNNYFKATLVRDGNNLVASASAFGKTFGMTYMTGGKLTGNTAADNAEGMYTSVGYSAGNNRLIFNADDMTVAVSDGNVTRVVWNFGLKVNDRLSVGKTLDKFGAYNIRIAFERGAGGVIIRDWNGQRFDTPVLSGNGVNSASADIFADFTVNATAGKSYALPAPTAYDVIDGNISEVEVEVIYNNEAVLSKRPYVSGLTFTPSQEGSYTVRYTAYDSAGVRSVKDYTLNAGVARTGTRINYTHIDIPSRVGVGSVIAIPVGTVGVSNATIGERAFATKLTVKYNGAVVKDYDGKYVADGDMFTFDKAGAYAFEYASANAELPCAQTHTVTVTDDLPAVKGLNVERIYGAGEKVALCVPEFEMNGGGATATAVTVKYPSGVAYRSNENIFNEYGMYVVTYSATFGNRTYDYDCEFTVQSPKYAVGDGGFAAYGKTDYLPSREGVAVTLAGNNEFVYERVVDLSDNTKNDCLLRMYVTPFTHGEMEASGIDVKITDIHDPDNYVVVTTRREPGSETLSYVKAGAVGQTPSGWFGDAAAHPYCKQYVGGIYGRVVNLSPFGRVNVGKTEPEPFEIYFDYAERQVHIGSTGVAGWDNRLVADLDSSDEFSSLWTRGFTTGEVEISIKPYGMSSGEYNFFITDIDGHSLADTGRNVSAPRIEVDLGGYDENDLPIAQVGKPYPLFEASAHDGEAGKLKVDVCAVLIASPETEVVIDIKDGKFVPAAYGTYILRYSAVNSYGVIAYKNLTVQVVKTAPAINVSAVADMRGNAGERANITLPTVTGGSGKPAIKAEYVSPSGKSGVIDNGSFVPDEIGEYTIKYTVVDYLGNEAVSTAEFTSLPSSEHIADGEARLPAAFINGVTYAVPELYVLDRSGSTVERKKASVAITYNSAPVAVTDGKFTPSVEKSGDKIQLTYTYGTFEKTYSVAVNVLKENGKFYAVEHFAAQNMSITATQRVNDVADHKVVLTAKTAEGSAEWLLPLVAGVFKTEFDVLESGKTKKVDLYVTDSEDDGISVKLSLLKTAEGQQSRLQVNDGASFRINGSYFPQPANNKNFITRFTVGYDVMQKAFTDGKKAIVSPETTLSGEPFDGFPSGYVRLRIAVQGRGGSIGLRYINNQRMSESTAGGSPDIFMIEGETRTYMPNAEITLPAAYASDVLDYETEYFRVTVTDPDGNTAISTDGVTLKGVAVGGDYRVKLEKSGAYTFLYEAKSVNGRKNSYTYIIRVRDIEPPVITVSAESIADVALGGTVSIPAATVVGGTTETPSVYVVNPYGMVRTVENSFSETTVRGTYKIRYVAFDSYGNMAVRELAFRVV